MIAEAKVKQWGNSLGIIIPKDVAKIEEIYIGDTVKIEISKDKKTDGFGIWKGTPSFIREHDDREEFW